MVFIHGGGFVSGDKGAITIRNICESFTKRGYVCASIQYRLVGDNPTYEAGPATNLSVLYRSMNAASQDAAKAIRWLRQNAATYHIDPTRIGIGGSSAGAITSLYTASQEAAAIGPDAEVGVVIDLWGAMYGAESFVDAGDPAIFIVHGTDDPTVAYSETQNLVAHLDNISHPYQLYPITGAGHGPWSQYNNDVVNGKTIFQHSVEFAFEHLELIDLHPAGNSLTNQPSLNINYPSNEITFNFPTYQGFQYLLQSSETLSVWTTENPTSSISGTGSTLFFSLPISATKKFYRVEIFPDF
jgi:acetyl esterase/lipase